MQIFLYEWITGGGLVEESGRLPQSLLAEGSAMLRALAADFAAIPGAKVTVLRDARLTELPLPRCEVREVHSSPDLADQFGMLAAAADWTLIVAPEFDGILRSSVAQVRDAGGRSLNGSDAFIALAADKHRTAETLRTAGVAAPVGRIVAGDEEKLPPDFGYPGVLKPIDGAGAQHTLLVASHLDEPPPYPWPRRLEAYFPGRAASVSALCGASGIHPLPPCWQDQSADGRFTYFGGVVIDDPALRERAAALALRALRALPHPTGYVGVDVVLGQAEDGSQDAVIEVNPRVTTSYVGVRASLKENLAEQLINAVRGDAVELTVDTHRVEFTASGAVRRR